MPFMPYSVCGVGGVQMADLDRRHFGSAGEQVVGQGAGKGLARIVIGYLFGAAHYREALALARLHGMRPRDGNGLDD